jgi:drug/metabolite transporter (DMT)-like permease
LHIHWFWPKVVVYPNLEKTPMQSNLFRAVAIILFGIVAFDMMAVTVRMLGGEYPILQISVLRNIFGIIPALLLLIIGPGLSSLRRILNKHYLKIIMIRSIAILVAQFSYYTALTKIEFATAATLGFTSPFFVTLLSIPLLGHQIGFVRFAAIIIGFLGVTVIFQPFNDSFTFWMLLPVLAGFGYGLSSVLVRLIPDEVPSAAIQISQQLLTCILGFCFLISFDDIKPIGSINDLYLFTLMGFCGGVGVLCLVISYRLADPSSVSVFEYFGIPVSFILGWLFFTEAPFSTLFPGVLLIISAGLLIIFRERRVHQDNI